MKRLLFALILSATFAWSVPVSIDAQSQKCGIRAQLTSGNSLPNAKLGKPYESLDTKIKLLERCEGAPNIRAEGLPPGICIGSFDCNQLTGILVSAGDTITVPFRGTPKYEGPYRIRLTVVDEAGNSAPPIQVNIFVNK